MAKKYFTDESLKTLVTEIKTYTNEATEEKITCVKLTQSEYDALPTSKNSDGILYAIEDGEDSSTTNNGSIKPVELTQAAYDALGDSVLNDNILYAITDGADLTAKNMFYDGSKTVLGNNVQNAIDELDNKVNEQNKNLDNITNYKSEETIVGTWIDGRTIYRRVYTGSLSSSTDTIIDSNSGMSDIISVVGRLQSTSNNAIASLGDYLNANVYSGVYLTSAKALMIYNSSQLASSRYIAVVEYLK